MYSILPGYLQTRYDRSGSEKKAMNRKNRKIVNVISKSTDCFLNMKTKIIKAQRKKKLICLEEIAKNFELGKIYEEKAGKRNGHNSFRRLLYT